MFHLFHYILFFSFYNCFVLYYPVLTKAVIVRPQTSPAVKIKAIRALGAEVVLCETSQRFEIAEKICAERGAVMIPPFNDETIMAGQGTIGLEVLEQCPEVHYD